MRQARAGAEFQWANVALGLWVASLPAAYDLSQEGLPPALVASGLSVTAASLAALRRPGVRWGVALLGVWLMFLPLVFWAREAVVYDTCTLIGSLLALFSVLSRSKADQSGLVPLGWSYNPSSYAQRAPIIGFALLSFFTARHLTAFQLGYIEAQWDPFFGDGTRRVLESEVSRSFPVSDAGLGAVSYLVEALTGLAGDQRRWRTMPWMVLFFGVLVVPLGVVSITLVVLQPVAVGAWCTLCLATAVLMLLMVSPAFDEVVASVQFLMRARRRGLPFWKTLFHGASDESDEQTQEETGIGEAIGFSHAPMSLVAAAALGVALMAAPSLLGLTGAVATACYVVGPLATTFAVIAVAEVARSARWLLLPLAVWLAGASALQSSWLTLAAAVVLGALAAPRGGVTERFGGWEKRIV